MKERFHWREQLRGLASKEFTQLGKTGTAQVPGGRDKLYFCNGGTC